MSEECLEEFMSDAKEILEDEGYHVYFENESYVYKHSTRRVQSNEVLVAIREDEEE